MAYADFDFYSGTFLGMANQADFTRLCPQAGAVIDRCTAGRAESAQGDALNMVKMAQCAVIDALLRQENGGCVLEETNDGISRRYAEAGARSRRQELEAAAELYLWRTGLMCSAV